VAAVGQLGTKWVQVAKLLPGRPENSVKNRWHCIKKRKDPDAAAAAAVAAPALMGMQYC
jgi:hypothetical protein